MYFEYLIFLFFMFSIKLYSQPNSNMEVYSDEPKYEFLVPYLDSNKRWGWKSLDGSISIDSSFEQVGFFHCFMRENTKFCISIVTEESETNLYLAGEGLLLPKGYELVYESSQLLEYNKKSDPRLADLILLRSKNGQYRVYSILDHKFLSENEFSSFDEQSYLNGLILLYNNKYELYSVSLENRTVEQSKFTSTDVFYMLDSDSTFVDSRLVLNRLNGEKMKFSNKSVRDWTKMDSILYSKVDKNLLKSIPKHREGILNERIIGEELDSILNYGDTINLLNLSSLQAGMDVLMEEGISITIDKDSISFINFSDNNKIFTIRISRIEYFEGKDSQVKVKMNDNEGAIDFYPLGIDKFVPPLYDKISLEKCINIDYYTCEQIYRVEQGDIYFYVDSYGNEFRY